MTTSSWSLSDISKLNISNKCTKFHVSDFNHFRDSYKNRLRDPDQAPFPDDVPSAIWDLLRSTYVSIFTHYEDMNADARCRKWCLLGWLWVIQGDRQCHYSIESIDFLFIFNENCVPLYSWRDIAKAIKYSAIKYSEYLIALIGNSIEKHETHTERSLI